MTNDESEKTYKVVPGEGAKHVGELLANKIFEQFGNPETVAMDKECLGAVCALAAQTFCNGFTGEWQ